MYLYGLFSFFTIIPDGEEYRNFHIARKIFGVIMMVWATHIAFHWWFDFRGTNNFLSHTLCLSCYYPCVMLFEVMYSSLIDLSYPLRQRFKRIAITTLILNAILIINYSLVQKPINNIILILIAVCFAIEVVYLSYRFLKKYHTALKRADNYYSDNTAIFVRWMINSVRIAIVFGFAGSIVLFLSKSGVSVYMLGGLLVFSYIFFSLQNYMINITKIKDLLLLESKMQETELEPEPIQHESHIGSSENFNLLEKRLNDWVVRKGFTQHSLTIEELATEIGTNRTYLSAYINTTYSQSFREWIAKMRIEYSKELLLAHTDLSANKIAAMVGYSSNAFSTIFFKLENTTPTKWRNH